MIKRETLSCKALLQGFLGLFSPSLQGVCSLTALRDRNEAVGLTDQRLPISKLAGLRHFFRPFRAQMS